MVVLWFLMFWEVIGCNMVWFVIMLNICKLFCWWERLLRWGELIWKMFFWEVLSIGLLNRLLSWLNVIMICFNNIVLNYLLIVVVIIFMILSKIIILIFYGWWLVWKECLVLLLKWFWRWFLNFSIEVWFCVFLIN